MSEPSNLVPNINEIMEKYAELENQTIQVTQIVAEQVEERTDENEAHEQTMEESRKRKRGGGEAEAKQRKERVRSFISDKAVALIKRSLKDKGFIVERGFKELISPFAEKLEKRG